jgi:hypothetical protein
MELKIQPRHFFLFLNAQEKFKTSRLNNCTFFVISSHTAGVRCAVRSLLLGPNRNGSVSLTKLSIFFLSILFFFFFFKLVYYLAYSLTVNNKKNSSGKESQPRKRKTKIN